MMHRLAITCFLAGAALVSTSQYSVLRTSCLAVVDSSNRVRMLWTADDGEGVVMLADAEQKSRIRMSHQGVQVGVSNKSGEFRMLARTNCVECAIGATSMGVVDQIALLTIDVGQNCISLDARGESCVIALRETTLLNRLSLGLGANSLGVGVSSRGGRCEVAAGKTQCTLSAECRSNGEASTMEVDVKGARCQVSDGHGRMIWSTGQ